MSYKQSNTLKKKKKILTKYKETIKRKVKYYINHKIHFNMFFEDFIRLEVGLNNRNNGKQKNNKLIIVDLLPLPTIYWPSPYLCWFKEFPTPPNYHASNLWNLHQYHPLHLRRQKIWVIYLCPLFFVWQIVMNKLTVVEVKLYTFSFSIGTS